MELSKIALLVSHQNKEIQKESCWSLSNIAAGKIPQIQAFIDSGIIPLLLEKSLSPKIDVRVDNEVRTEARWAILNCISCGNNNQVEEVAKLGGIGVLLETLDELDSSMVSMALDGVDKVIDINFQYIAHIDPNKIIQLVGKPPLSISKKSEYIWLKHFVQCQICKNAYAKMLKVTKYCSECKCFVCSSCN